MDTVPPFSEQEMRFVVAEAIKNSSVPIDRLLPVLLDGSVVIDWHQMLLPHGRNVKSCMDALEALKRIPPQPQAHFSNYNPAPVPPPRPSTKRKSGPDNLDAPGGSTKRRHSDIAQPILPKPSNGSQMGGTPQSTPGGKKRGRPSKETVEKRQREAIARGEVIAPSSSSAPRTDIQPREESISTPTYANIAPMMSPRPIISPSTMPSFEHVSRPEADSVERKRRARPGPKPSTAPEPSDGTIGLIRPPEQAPISLPPVASGATEASSVILPAMNYAHQPARQNQAPLPTTQGPPPV